MTSVGLYLVHTFSQPSTMASQKAMKAVKCDVIYESYCRMQIDDLFPATYLTNVAYQEQLSTTHH